MGELCEFIVGQLQVDGKGDWLLSAPEEASSEIFRGSVPKLGLTFGAGSRSSRHSDLLHLPLSGKDHLEREQDVGLPRVIRPVEHVAGDKPGDPDIPQTTKILNREARDLNANRPLLASGTEIP